MIKSMTGYGRASVTEQGRTVTAEVKSVNHRYFDCTVKASRMYGFLEEPLKKLSQDIISRGRVDIFVTVDAAQSDDVEVTPNRHVFAAYLEGMRAMCREYGLPDTLTINDIARFPEVFTVSKKETDAEALTTEALQALRTALSEFDTMRVREGERLRDDILSRAQAMEEMLSRVEERAPLYTQAHREKVETRVRDYLGELEPDEGRLLTELAVFADRAAIDEEIVRLRSHFSQLRTMLSQSAPVGRKLDFLIQEMNRETNTIGSKTGDLETTKIVVDIKAELEKIREQIQNIE